MPKINRAISFEQACNRYSHRYTMQHVPAWAREPQTTAEGKTVYYAPQYRTCGEWYEKTVFPGEGHISARSHYCESSNQSWPLGRWLDKPYQL